MGWVVRSYDVDNSSANNGYLLALFEHFNDKATVCFASQCYELVDGVLAVFVVETVVVAELLAAHET